MFVITGDLAKTFRYVFFFSTMHLLLFITHLLLDKKMSIIGSTTLSVDFAFYDQFIEMT